MVASLWDASKARTWRTALANSRICLIVLVIVTVVEPLLRRLLLVGGHLIVIW
jgi:hypothetical protein